MKKAVYVLLGIIVIGLLVWNFLPSPKQFTGKVTIINPVGPAVIPVAGLNSGKITSTVPSELKFWKSNDEVVAMLSGQDAQFAVLPVTVAANLYARGIDLVMLGVHEWKVFYLVGANGQKFTDWSSLKGKNVYTPEGKGQTADVLMRAALTKAGLTPDQDVKILYAAPPEIVTLFKSGKIDYAALPEPYATMAISGGQGQVVLDFQKYWAELTGNPERLPIAGLFVKRTFLKDYPHETAVIEKAFMESTQWGNNNLNQALEASKTLLPIPQPVMKAAYEHIDFHYVASPDCRSEVEAFLQKMKEFYPQGLTKLPDQAFYRS